VPVKTQSLLKAINVSGESKQNIKDEENSLATLFPPPPVPEGHKVVHVLRHFRAWHK
jgi:hypothetical protein